MGNRCASCNKFASLEVGEPSVDDVTVDADHEAMKTWEPGKPSFLTVRTSVSAEKTSECCGDTVKTASAETEEDVLDQTLLALVRDHLRLVLPDDEEHDLEIEDLGASLDEDTGKADVEWSIVCCGETLGSGMTQVEVIEWEDA